MERVILPDSFIALDHMLRRFTRIVQGLVVHADRMRENLERSRGVVFSGTVLLELAQRGVSREQAYEWVQRNAMRSLRREEGLQGSCCWPTRDVMGVLVAPDDRRGVRSRRAAAGTSTIYSIACSVRRRCRLQRPGGDR